MMAIMPIPHNTHSTGHRARLARESITEAAEFGSAIYSKEELIAEMGGAYLCAEAGISNAVIDNQAAYIVGWLKRLRDDRRLVILAAVPERSIRNGILGRNAAVPYGIDASAKLQALSCDQLETAREEYRAEPFGPKAMLGPRTRRELLAMLRRDPWWRGAGAYQSSRSSIYLRK